MKDHITEGEKNGHYFHHKRNIGAAKPTLIYV